METLRNLWSRLDRSVRARIILPTAVLFAVVLGTMVYVAVSAYGIDIEKVQRERAEIFAANVASGVTQTMMEGQPNQVPDLLELARSHRADLESISLLRPDGQVAYSTDRRLIGSLPWGGMEKLNQPRVVSSPGGESAQYAVLRPIPNVERCASCHGRESRINGWVDLRFSRAPALSAQGELARTLAVSTGVALLILLAIAWWLIGREAVHPLHRLVAAMARAESGDLTVRADEGRPDELGTAARGFDATLAALRRSQAELEAFYRERMVRADRFATVGEMATGLAHEIKNPLAGLSGALELLAEDLSENPRQSEVVGEMRHQVARLTNTMESLLSFARPPKAHLRDTDLHATLQKVLFLVRQQRRLAAVHVEVELGEVPHVLADPSQLEQVFLNICLNACQAMGAAGGRLTVRSRLAEGRVAVDVEDTGPGIPESVRPNLFKPFFTTKREGNGLGLAISARIVAEHGGNIGYRCPAGGGTIFTVTLQPARPAAERPTEISA
ncbi:MAG TPA: ATP-binding protein [Anaeromyxobacteraceae bacterium]|nr:ATP-binding protein [Anaeromyxobacteraceae bacterium]